MECQRFIVDFFSQISGENSADKTVSKQIQPEVGIGTNLEHVWGKIIRSAYVLS